MFWHPGNDYLGMLNLVKLDLKFPGAASNGFIASNIAEGILAADRRVRLFNNVSDRLVSSLDELEYQIDEFDFIEIDYEFSSRSGD